MIEFRGSGDFEKKFQNCRKSQLMRIDSAVMTVDDAEKALDVPAQLIGEKTMLPLRALAESAGFAVDWDERIKCVYISGAK